MLSLFRLVLVAVFLPVAAFAQDAQTLADIRAEIARLQADFNSLKSELVTTGAAATGAAGGDALQRMDAIEAALMRLTAKTEEVELKLNRVVLDTDIKGEKRTVNPDGEVKFSYEVARSNNQIFQAGLLLFIILIGAISSVATTAAILSRRRPPSISTLAWLATYLFALIQVRAEFPGNPPLGVNIDRFFTFPVMAIIMALIVANAISWLRRDDWDSENQDYEG